MRKQILFLLATACAVAFVTPSFAQPLTNAPATNVTAHPNPQMRLFQVRNAINNIDRVIVELKRSENDFDGHKQTAIDACAKAREELAAVAKSAGIPLTPVRQPRPMVPPQGGAAPRPAAPATTTPQ